MWGRVGGVYHGYITTTNNIFAVNPVFTSVQVDSNADPLLPFGFNPWVYSIRTFAPQKPVASFIARIPCGTPTGWASSPPLRQSTNCPIMGNSASGNALLRQQLKGVGAA